MTRLQWCLPLTAGRGAGLGNELVPWARAYLMAREIGARTMAPAFGLNQRGYACHFGGGRFDWLRQRAMQTLLPVVHFGAAEYARQGADDAGVAFARFAQECGLQRRGPLLVTTEGLWGGLHHVQRARQFVRGVLYRSRYAAGNLADLGARLDPSKLAVAMHVRLGDFDSQHPDASDAYRGRFNVSLPLDWFVEIGNGLRRAFGDGVQFQIFSDGSPGQLAPLHRALQPLPTACRWPADVSDLLAMAGADLLVCSVSSYSIWAAMLSDAPYVWFRPQMHAHAHGLLSIWGGEPLQQQPGSPTSAAVEAESVPQAHPGRSHAVAPGQELPDALIEQLRMRRAFRRRSADLVRYGVVPAVTDNADLRTD